jgi:pyruvate/2-oxoglutarate dehydrogenase complex dihydrolipoamide acyltransferase (E2) component
MIVKGDVLKAKSQPQATPSSSSLSSSSPPPSSSSSLSSPPPSPSHLDFEDIPLSMMRKVIAKRLLESKQKNPHSYAVSSMRMDQLIALRASVNKRLAESSSGEGKKLKVSINDLLIKCVSKALLLNPQFLQNREDSAPAVDISVAVSTDSGLITPIIQDTATKSVTDIHLNMKEMAGKARAGTLQPHEYSGGDFTISNLGMVKAISEFSAVINPPQHAILAVASTSRKPVLSEDETDFSFGTFCDMTLSSNRETVDEVDVGRFLDDLKKIVENPLANLL